jgi:uncharacterized protein (TIGR03000 family)
MRKTLSFCGTLLVAAAALTFAAAPAQAQHGHGGHGGSGGYHGGYSGGYHGGYGGYHGGYGGLYGGYGVYNHAYNWGFYPRAWNYGSSYGGYPYYNYTYTYPSYDYSPTYIAPTQYAVPYSSGYYNPESANAQQAPAHLTVKVPDNAELWIAGARMNKTGGVREFDTPPLNPGQTYHYIIQARWQENGRDMTQSQDVDFTASSKVAVNFPMTLGTDQPAPTGQPQQPAPNGTYVPDRTTTPNGATVPSGQSAPRVPLGQNGQQPPRTGQPAPMTVPDR